MFITCEGPCNFLQNSLLYAQSRLPHGHLSKPGKSWINPHREQVQVHGDSAAHLNTNNNIKAIETCLKLQQVS